MDETGEGNERERRERDKRKREREERERNGKKGVRQKCILNHRPMPSAIRRMWFLVTLSQVNLNE